MPKKPIEFFTDLKDPRIDRCKDHLLADIIFITVAAVICGAETWNDIENYGKSKQDWLRKYLKLPNGIPSHDTFNRLFTLLDPKELESSFLKWVKSIAKITKGEVVSIDGLLQKGVLDTFGFEKPDEQYQAKDFGHGRIEIRKCPVVTQLETIDERECESTNFHSVPVINLQSVTFRS